MAEFLELIGPEAMINFVQNWPFVAVTIGVLWYILRQLRECYKSQSDMLRMLLEKELKD